MAKALSVGRNIVDRLYNQAKLDIFKVTKKKGFTSSNYHIFVLCVKVLVQNMLHFKHKKKCSHIYQETQSEA